MKFNVSGNGRTVSSGVKFLRCGECGRGASPLDVAGNGKRGILVVFEQPTSTQWSARSWLAGGDSTVLWTLQELGLSLREDIAITAALPCHGSKNSNGNYEPCLIKLKETLKRLRPKVIITVGASATGAILRLYNPGHFAPNFTSAQYVGQCIPLNRNEENMWGCWLAPVQSERDIHLNKSTPIKNMAKAWLRRHVTYAVDVGGLRPSAMPIPEVKLLYDSKEITQVLEEAGNAKYAAFDYETNRLQPEFPKAAILTSAVTYVSDADDVQTVAFPMSSEVVKQAWCRFLQSDVKKIGANIKFEHRWSCVHLRTPVAHWFWDVCVAGRIMDCMPGNSGLKYLTFVNFGIIGYDDSVSSYMNDDADGMNGLEKAPPVNLLTYNGYDALYTYYCAKKQHEMFGLAF